MTARIKAMLFGAAVALCVGSTLAHAEIVVDTESDADDGGDGVCSLREAILAVNAHADYNECTDASGPSAGDYAYLVFDSSVHTIALQTALPTITNRISIDATLNAAACTPVPSVSVQIVNGNNLGGDGLVLDTGSDYSAVGGLAISGFDTGAGILAKSDFAGITCDVLGTDPTGMTAQPNQFGVVVSGANAAVGLISNSDWLPNLISGNSDTNVYLATGADDAVVAGNYIGVDATGLTPLSSGYGIFVQSTGARIGFRPGFGPPARQRNVIGVTAADLAVDIQVSGATDTAIAGNYIGVGADGQTALTIGTNGRGVSASSATGTLVGCDGTYWDDCRNVIAAPGGIDVATFDNDTGTAIVSNFLGVGADGTTSLGGAEGILMSGGQALVARNVIRTSGGYGIFLKANTSIATAVFANHVPAGSGGATLDSSDNCIHGNTLGGVYTFTNPTEIATPTTFLDNWWGAADGPAPGGSGDFASANVIDTPFLTASSPYCGFDRIFSDTFGAGATGN